MSTSNCCFLTCIQISQEAGKAVWYSHLLKNFPQFIVIHTVKGFGIINKAEVDVFLELSCFFDDPTDVGNLISGSSAFSKSCLNISKFMVHILLKPGLENFEHYFASVWDECNFAAVVTFFGIAFFRDWNENSFSSPVATAEFSKFAGLLSMCVSVLVAQLCPALCDPMDCTVCQAPCPWDFPGKDTGVCCHFLLQRIFPTQGSNLDLLPCNWMLYCLSY